MQSHPILRRAALAAALTASLAAPLLHGQARVNTAEDDPFYGNYEHGWRDGMNSGGGFGPWVLKASETNDGFKTWAGFFIAQNKPDLNGIARGGKAWGLYANGQRYEEAVACRSLNHPLEPGETFSVFFEFTGFESKWGADSLRPGRTGIALRSKDAPDTLEGYREGARVIVEITAASPNYIVSDAEREWDTGVKVDPMGALITVTPRGLSSYNLEIKTLSKAAVNRFTNRKLGGDSHKKIEGFCFFALNTETHDVYFSGLQVATPLPPADDAVRNMVQVTK